MKKSICILLTLILVFATTSVLTGCGQHNLKGTWEGCQYEVSSNGEKTKLGNVKLCVTNNEAYVIGEDFSDGTCFVVRYSSYEVFKDKKIVVFESKDVVGARWHYELDGDSLTLTNGESIVKLQRQ